MTKSPAEVVIEKFGGFQPVADVLKCHVSRVYRWTYSADRGGTGGSIPQKHQIPLLDAARQMGIDLKPEDFFPAASPSTAAA